MSSPSRNSQIENLISWFAASVIVAAGVIYGFRPQPEPRAAEPQPLLPRATPAQEPLTIQQRRALEKGRGRRAHAPLQIPWRGWRDILVRTYYEIQEDRLLALAAGVSFYSLLSLFPGLAAGVSVYALFADPVMISRHLSVAAGVVPAETLDLLTTEISRIAAKSDGKLTFGFLLGLAIALWSANAGMKAIFDALNIIYDEQEKRGLIGSMASRCSAPYVRMQVIALRRAIAGWMAVDATRTVEDLGYLGKHCTRPRILVGDTLEGCRGTKLIGRLRPGGDTTRDNQ